MNGNQIMALIDYRLFQTNQQQGSTIKGVFFHCLGVKLEKGLRPKRCSLKYYLASEQDCAVCLNLSLTQM